MSRISFNKGLLVAVALLTAILMSVSSSGTSLAVSCSGSGCNGKNPVTTGCNQNAYLAAHYPFYDNYGIILSPFSNKSPYMNVYYSRSCGTNWVQVTSNPYGGTTYKEIQVLKSNGGSGFLETENDKGYGSSYSMMVYAPGSTAIRVWSKLTNTSGVTKVRTADSVLR
jgi:hypothetical protein